ncbi:MAG: holo-ACP synthase [Myxococcales bacterium]|nr:holo-ACP synthase [Myxococcales bacterium]MCB9641764.1 holo-ACP synthase [Myxococcales bacterium]
MLGVGLDVVHVPSFEQQLQDPASCFVEETFTPTERRIARSRPGHAPARHLAARFAAKEALIKAWSSALFGSPPPLSHVSFREIEVIHDTFSRPALRLHGKVALALEALSPYHLHLSLSHDGDTAAAIVILEQAPTVSASP